MEGSKDPDGGETTYTSYFQSKSDKEIWTMFLAGHEGAFSFIYESHFSTLFSYGFHFTPDRELIKDAIHDLFFEMRQSEGLSQPDSIKLYLLKAFRWKLLRLLNKKKSLQESSFDSSQPYFDTHIEVSVESGIIQMESGTQNAGMLKKALLCLTDRQREALYYFYEQDLSYSQVAQMMELGSAKAARNIIYKAIASLQVYFKTCKK
jgi:RNA polymerase sigma-70 factor (ECF subfamily)